MAKIKTSSGVISFKQKLLYPGCHLIDRDKAYINLLDISNILNTKDIQWGPIFGTLLGIVRESNFIEWDEDIDLYILEEDEAKFINILYLFQNEGFKLIRREQGGLYSILRDDEYVDFYILKKAGSDVRFTLDGGFILEKYLSNQTSIFFKDVSLKIPIEVEEYLTFEYGDWRTPVRYFPPQLTMKRRLFLVIYYYFRIYSPKWIYNWWIRKRRTKDLLKFKEKCANKGVSLNKDTAIPNSVL